MPQSLYLFDPARPDFMPYGFTCEQWTPHPMKRPDRHNEIEFNLILEGEIVYLLGGSTVTLRSGCLGVFWASVPHQIIACSGDVPYYVATVPLAWFLACRLPGFAAQRLLSGEMLIETLGRRTRLDQELFRQWTEDLESDEEARKQIALREMEARLQRLVLNAEPDFPVAERQAHVPSVNAAGGEKVAQIAYFVAQNYTERLSVEGVAKYVGLHPNYAMELFRRTLGTTLIDYINHHRVTHAQRLLVTSEETILEVAMSSGFNSLSRFNAVFKARAGCTPRSYRRDHRVPLH